VAIFLAVCLPALTGVILARVALAADDASWVPELLRIHLSGIAEKLPILLAVIGGAFVLHVVGLVDDVKPLGPVSKLLVEIAVALFLAIGWDVRVATALGPVASVALTVFWFVLVINAFNFLDNMDGLSAGVAAIAAAIIAGTSMIAGQIFVPRWPGC
jgi:UDP-GlcNAc:undecaprenyl-phosphate GlcNAc-1-phosphate transferase